MQKNTGIQVIECVFSQTEDCVIEAKKVAAILHDTGYEERAINCIYMSIIEALFNAISHGNRNDPCKKVYMTCLIDEYEFRVEIQDEGNGFNPRQVPDPTLPENLMRTHGRGIMMMRTLMDDLEFNESGNLVRMRKSHEKLETKQV